MYIVRNTVKSTSAENILKIRSNSPKKESSSIGTIIFTCLENKTRYDTIPYILSCERVAQDNTMHNMGLINKVDMVCLSPVGYGV